MRALLTALGKFVLGIFATIAKFQAWLLNDVCTKIPGWNVVLALCSKILAPVTTLGGWLQRKFPKLRKLEWLFEIDALRARHPVMLVLSLALIFWRGILQTKHGHIATDPIIYPLLGGLSYLNPFLGLVAAITFGAADLVQKIFWNDMYGTDSTGDWIGGLVGYVIGYSAVAAMGLFPGMLSRVFSLVVRKILQAVFSGGAKAAADGAAGGFGPPAGGGGVPAAAWRQVVYAGHPLDSEWDRYLSARPHELGADALARLQVPPEGLAAHVAAHGEPPGGWARFCGQTGMQIPPGQIGPDGKIRFLDPNQAAGFLRAHGIPPGPPVPSAAAWLAQTRGAPAGPAGDEAVSGPARAPQSRSGLGSQPGRSALDQPGRSAANQPGRGALDPPGRMPPAAGGLAAPLAQGAAAAGAFVPPQTPGAPTTPYGAASPAGPASIPQSPGGLARAPGEGDDLSRPPEVPGDLTPADGRDAEAAASAAAAARARARRQAEDFEIRRQLDLAREQAMAERRAWEDTMAAQLGMRGAFMPEVQGGPPDAAFVLPELIASLVGAALGGWAVVDFVAPVAEWPAFYLRPNPDVSCYSAEVGYLNELAPEAGTGTALVGPAVSILTPGGGTGLAPGIDPDALKQVIDTRDYHQNNANRLRQDLATATDPRVREELTRRLEATEANVASANDEIHRAQTGEFRRTRTAWDDRQDAIQRDQSAAMAADLKARAAARDEAARKAAAAERRPEWQAEQDRLQREADRMAAQTGLGFVLTRAFTGSVKEVVDTGSDAFDWTKKTAGEAWEFGKKVVKDPKGYAKAALSTTWQGVRGAANYVAETGTELWRDVRDGRTWEIVKGTAGGSALTVAKIVGTTGQAIYQTITDPKKAWAAAKEALGGNDFEKSWDPNIPLSQRIGHVGLGVFKLYGTLTTAGQAGALARSGLNALGKSQVVGKIRVGVKSALGLADDVVKVPKPKVYPPRPAKFVPGIDNQVSLSPGTNIKPQLKGMTDPGMKHLQVVADKHGARIAVRPSNPYSNRLIEQGAHPKPAWQKMKTITDTDTHIGAHIDSRGKVGLFEPKLPDRKLFDDKTWSKIESRYKDRMKEWHAYGDDFKAMEAQGKIKIREGAIHAPDGTPYAGDYDIFQVTGANGEKLPDAVRDRIIRELQAPPFNAQHPAHLDWATTTAKEAGMKVNIASSHASTVPGVYVDGVLTKPPHPGEPLITAIGGETARSGPPGGRFVGSHYNIPPDAGDVL